MNVDTNMETVAGVGLHNYIFEVVTDKALNLPPNARVREIVVPNGYRTKSGALYKARALQYCLEDDVNILRDDDWIVHLDEETLKTDNSVCCCITLYVYHKCSDAGSRHCQFLFVWQTPIRSGRDHICESRHCQLDFNIL